MAMSPRTNPFVKFRKRHFEGNEENIPEPTGWDSGIGFQKWKKSSVLTRTKYHSSKNLEGLEGKIIQCRKTKDKKSQVILYLLF
jgi:hypothetical protein